MKILITGAAGFIGSHLAERLLAEGHEVIGLDNFSNYYNYDLKSRNAEAIVKAGGSVRHLDLVSDDITANISSVEAVFHLAAQPGISSSVSFDAYERNNVVATKRLLDAFESTSSLSVFVNFCTSSVYGKVATGNEESAPNPASYYGVTKLAAEQLVLARYRETGFPAMSIRPFSIIGERERPEKLFPKIISSILADISFPLFEGSRDHIRSFTYVGDLIDGAVLAFSNPTKSVGEIFNIGNDTTTTVGESIDIIEGLLGKKAQIENVPKRSGDQTETSADITKARTILGYAPKVTLTDALTREVLWARELKRI